MLDVTRSFILDTIRTYFGYHRIPKVTPLLPDLVGKRGRSFRLAVSYRLKLLTSYVCIVTVLSDKAVA